MRNWPTVLRLALFAALSLPACARAQNADHLSAADVPVAAPGADLTGVWTQFPRIGGRSAGEGGFVFSKEEPPMTAWGEAQYKAAKPSFGTHSFSIEETNDPVYRGCFPPGMPRIFLHPFPMQIVEAPGEVIMLFEYDSMRRQIFTDGRPHSDGAGPTWMGDSVGHWEKDTLVVDTVGFNDKTWLDRIGHPHTSELHLTERIRRPDHDTLVDDITIQDPKAYTKPWTAHEYFELKTGWNLLEQFCEDNVTFSDVEKKETTGKGK